MTPYYEQDGITIYHGDCREILPHLPKVDLVLTDPPYGIGYASSWTTQLNGQPRKRDSSFGVDRFNGDWLPMLWERQKDNSLLFMFTRWDVLHLWREAAELCGYKTRQRLIWDKAHWKMGDLSYYGSQVEDVLLLSKGSRPIFDGGMGRRGNIFRSSSSSYLPEGQENHPTQKSVKTCAEFVRDGSQPSETVLDPFMGSGTTLVAAKQLGRKAIGIEIEEKYCEIAAKRLAQMELFA